MVCATLHLSRYLRVNNGLNHLPSDPPLRLDEQNALGHLRKCFLENSIVHGVLSSPKATASETLRTDVRPVLIQGARVFQFTYQTATQHRHENLGAEEAADRIESLLLSQFRNLTLKSHDACLDIKQSKKGKFFASLSRSQNSVPASVSNLEGTASHNRTRNYVIPEGTPCPFLIETGVMNESGKVLASHSKKFRQINRFAEFIVDVIREINPQSKMHIVDFGCGKSYLTFATHHLLTEVLKLECEIVGLDLRPDVIATCTQVVEKLNLTNLRFELGDIEGFQSTDRVDMVISLHACDTATDSALLKGVGWRSQAILAVPCCQHELNGLLEKGSVPVLASHGILKERMAAMATDGMRAKLLEAVGYKTQMLEFIETEHTPKNLMIRAVLPGSGQRMASSRRAACLQEVEAFRQAWGVEPLFMEKRLLELGLLANR
jgi:SAM-dependent methyltransferase